MRSTCQTSRYLFHMVIATTPSGSTMTIWSSHFIPSTQKKTPLRTRRAGTPTDRLHWSHGDAPKQCTLQSCGIPARSRLLICFAGKSRGVALSKCSILRGIPKRSVATLGSLSKTSSRNARPYLKFRRWIRRGVPLKWRLRRRDV